MYVRNQVLSAGRIPALTQRNVIALLFEQYAVHSSLSLLRLLDHPTVTIDILILINASDMLKVSQSADQGTL